MVGVNRTASPPVGGELSLQVEGCPVAGMNPFHAVRLRPFSPARLPNMPHSRVEMRRGRGAAHAAGACRA